MLQCINRMLLINQEKTIHATLTNVTAWIQYCASIDAILINFFLIVLIMICTKYSDWMEELLNLPLFHLALQCWYHHETWHLQWENNIKWKLKKKKCTKFVSISIPLKTTWTRQTTVHNTAFQQMNTFNFALQHRNTLQVNSKHYSETGSLQPTGTDKGHKQLPCMLFYNHWAESEYSGTTIQIIKTWSYKQGSLWWTVHVHQLIKKKKVFFIKQAFMSTNLLKERGCS